MPGNKASDVIGKQILRSATSIGANYRSACKARSKADFISKITIVEEEADETQYWLELLAESGLVEPKSVADLLKEAKELTQFLQQQAKQQNKISNCFKIRN